VETERVRKRVVAHGRVQGVFFRDSVRSLADEHGVSGFARNLADGSVEAAFEGPPGAVDELVAFCGEGHEHARVSRIEVTVEPPRGTSGFTIS
jgi:acylphosphatase